MGGGSLNIDQVNDLISLLTTKFQLQKTQVWSLGKLGEAEGGNTSTKLMMVMMMMRRRIAMMMMMMVLVMFDGNCSTKLQFQSFRPQLPKPYRSR